MNNQHLEIDNLNWRCFLALEEDLLNTQFFADIHEENYNTFSIRYRSLILQSCAEIEAILKKICGKKSCDRFEYKDYYAFLSENHNGFFNIKILMPSFAIELTPWASSDLKDPGKPPNFWSDNNKIKHAGEFKKATLKNALDALAALFSVLLAWYAKNYGADFASNDRIIVPKLFSYPNLDATHLITQNSFCVSIPGFERVNADE